MVNEQAGILVEPSRPEALADAGRSVESQWDPDAVAATIQVPPGRLPRNDTSPHISPLNELGRAAPSEYDPAKYERVGFGAHFSARID